MRLRAASVRSRMRSDAAALGPNKGVRDLACSAQVSASWVRIDSGGSAASPSSIGSDHLEEGLHLASPRSCSKRHDKVLRGRASISAARALWSVELVIKSHSLGGLADDALGGLVVRCL